MSIEQMRSAIKKVYPGEKWKNRVSRMPDDQILAIYHKFIDDKKIK